MGYTLTIGQMVVEYDNDKECPAIRISAAPCELANAPAYGEPTDFKNSRWPSYSSWVESMRFCGLYELMYGKKDVKKSTMGGVGVDETVRDDGLLTSHPGATPITERHRNEINGALIAYKIKYPQAKPTYGDMSGSNFRQGDDNNPVENGMMCRLVWLHFWVNWALDNCQQPVFENS